MKTWRLGLGLVATLVFWRWGFAVVDDGRSTKALGVDTWTQGSGGQVGRRDEGSRDGSAASLQDWKGNDNVRKVKHADGAAAAWRSVAGEMSQSLRQMWHDAQDVSENNLWPAFSKSDHDWTGVAGQYSESEMRALVRGFPGAGMFPGFVDGAAEEALQRLGLVIQEVKNLAQFVVNLTEVGGGEAILEKLLHMGRDRMAEAERAYAERLRDLLGFPTLRAFLGSAGGQRYSVDYRFKLRADIFFHDLPALARGLPLHMFSSLYLAFKLAHPEERPSGSTLWKISLSFSDMFGVWTVFGGAKEASASVFQAGELSFRIWQDGGGRPPRLGNVYWFSSESVYGNVGSEMAVGTGWGIGALAVKLRKMVQGGRFGSAGTAVQAVAQRAGVAAATMERLCSGLLKDKAADLSASESIIYTYDLLPMAHRDPHLIMQTLAVEALGHLLGRLTSVAVSRLPTAAGTVAGTAALGLATLLGMGALPKYVGTFLADTFLSLHPVISGYQMRFFTISARVRTDMSVLKRLKKRKRPVAAKCEVAVKFKVVGKLLNWGGMGRWVDPEAVDILVEH